MRILSLREAFKETFGFPKALTQLLDDVHYNQEGEGSCNVHLNEKNTEQVSKLEFMCNVMEKLAELEEVLIYMSQPVKGTGRLKKCENGFCEPDSKCLFVPGSRLEVLVTDKEQLVPFWGMTKLCYEPAEGLLMTQEAKDEDIYYFDGYEDVPVEGATIRYRGYQFYLDHTYR